jgi:hypothetical protein
MASIAEVQPDEIPECPGSKGRHIFIKKGNHCIMCGASKGSGPVALVDNAPKPKKIKKLNSDPLLWTVKATPDGFMELVHLPVSEHKRPIYRKYAILMKRDGDQCHFCQRRLLLKNCTVDHLIPRSRGGSSAMENMALACIQCNAAKGSMTESEFKEFVIHLAKMFSHML